jgi:hypothetical protein
MKNVSAPHPVHAPIRKGNGHAVPDAEFQALARRLSAHEATGCFHALGLRLHADHVAGAAHRFGEPEAVEADAAADVEPLGARRKAEIGDDASCFGLLEAIHPLQRIVRVVGTGHAFIVRERGATA